MSESIKVRRKSDGVVGYLVNGKFVPIVQKKPGILERMGGIIKTEYQRMEQKAVSAVDAAASGEQSWPEAVIQTGAAAVGSGAGIVGGGIMEGIKAVTPDFIETKVKEVVPYVANKALEASMPEQLVEPFKQNIAEIVGTTSEKVKEIAAEHPRLARNVTATGDIIKATGVIALGNAAENFIKKNVPKAFNAIKEKAINLVKTSDFPLDPGSPGAPVAMEKTLLTSGTPDARVADKLLTKEGKIVADPVAKEVIRQGIEPIDVALIKKSSASDKRAMNKMLNIREKQLTNAAFTDRASDVAGGTFIEKILIPIEKLNKKAGSQLGEIADLLADQKADFQEPISRFVNRLAKADVRITGDGTLQFTDSIFDGLPGPQKALQLTWQRIQKLSKTNNALQAHKVKNYIDEVVSYGKVTEGLSGKAVTMIKELRHNIDDVLDSNFVDYNAVNTTFSQTKTVLDNVKDAMGGSFKADETFASASAGTTLRRLFSQTKSRSDLLQMMHDATRLMRNYGMKLSDDIIVQAKFADILEKMLGTEASTGIQENITRGINAVGRVSQITSGQPRNMISAVADAASAAYKAVGGINQKNLIKSLRAILK